MTREEYEDRRRRLDAELRAGIDLLEQGHRAQVRALDLVWSIQDPSSPAPQVQVQPTNPSPIASKAAPAPRPRRRPLELANAVRGALDKLPPVFTKDDISRTLGESADRRGLFRVLLDLMQEGYLTIEERGQGRTPTSYRKLPSV
ncbi:MAG TPA: hypothetical protein VE078_13160 [Thermoanaerobaculia bacterium]|nr:hypothetical protein [Thermoanaerobaculia bacterium]